MRYSQALAITQTHLIQEIRALYALGDLPLAHVDSHEGGRNLVFTADGTNGPVVRISYLNDRTTRDFLAETEFVHYLRENGARVADALPSVRNNRVEPLVVDGHLFHVCVFERARGDQLADHGYKYRSGVPLEEYFINCGRTLGKMHALAKAYTPEYPRADMFAIYSEKSLRTLIPDANTLSKLAGIMGKLKEIPRTRENYGTLHFDFSDGNFMIDYNTGDITVFDFDNCMTGFYMYDLANLWVHGIGWTQFEKSADKRRTFMDAYFARVLEGYKMETTVTDDMLALLKEFVDAVLVENIVDAYECARFAEEDDDEDAERLQRNMHLLMNDIPFMGYFEDDCI